MVCVGPVQVCFLGLYQPIRIDSGKTLCPVVVCCSWHICKVDLPKATEVVQHAHLIGSAMLFCSALPVPTLTLHPYHSLLLQGEGKKGLRKGYLSMLKMQVFTAAIFSVVLSGEPWGWRMVCCGETPRGIVEETIIILIEASEVFGRERPFSGESEHLQRLSHFAVRNPIRDHNVFPLKTTTLT